MAKEQFELCPLFDQASGKCIVTQTARQVLSRVDHTLQPGLIISLSKLTQKPDLPFLAETMISKATPTQDRTGQVYLLCDARKARRGDPAAIAASQKDCTFNPTAKAMTDPTLIEWRADKQQYSFEYPKAEK